MVVTVTVNISAAGNAIATGGVVQWHRHTTSEQLVRGNNRRQAKDCSWPVL